MKQDIFEKRNYINREHLLVVNSGDRDWMNETEDRYSFQVRFKPSTGENGESGLGVDNLYRNIVSFEMVRVLILPSKILLYLLIIDSLSITNHSYSIKDR